MSRGGRKKKKKQLQVFSCFWGGYKRITRTLLLDQALKFNYNYRLAVVYLHVPGALSELSLNNSRDIFRRLL